MQRLETRRKIGNLAHRVGLTLALVVAAVLRAGAARAQQTIEARERLEFDRPEAWAAKYYASIVLPTGMGVPQAMGAGSVAFTLEGGLVPHLSEEERRVGFRGTKVEDLNKTPLFGRVRVTVGLSESTSAELDYTPPIEAGGARPHLLSLALGRSFEPSPRWRLGLRAYGHLGKIQADITCSAEEAAAGRDPDRNPFLCIAPSNDTARQRMLGTEVSAGYGAGSWRPWVSVAATWMDLEFQVGARYGDGEGVVDRTLQLTRGATLAATAGVAVTPSERWSVAAELLYSWLSVARPPATSARNEGVLTGRLFVTYTIR